MNKKNKNKKKESNSKMTGTILSGVSVAVLILIFYISSNLFFRIDLTSDKRYTLSQPTKEILRNLNDVIYVEVFLHGEMPYSFKRLQKSIKELLDEFGVYGRDNIIYEFVNPSENSDEKVRNKVYGELMKKGLKPVNIEQKDKEGGISEKILFPGALITYKDRQFPVDLLRNNPGLPSETNLNNSIQMLEYELMNAFRILTDTSERKIAFLVGNGELESYYVDDITKALAFYYQVDRGVINGQLNCLDDYEAVIIAKPTIPFNEKDKFILDQYIMNGGNVLWLVDAVSVSLDSMSGGITMAMPLSLNIEDQLFKYGVRINSNLVKDIQCNVIPINTALAGNQPKWVPAPWHYFPLLSTSSSGHAITRNINMIKTEFVNSIDTVGGNPDIKKTVLLKSSSNAKLLNVPAIIDLKEVKNKIKRKEFNRSELPVAVLLEGEFESVFSNRLYNEFFPGQKIDFKDKSLPVKMIVVADGDVIKNNVRFTAKGPMITPLGFDRFTNQTFGNKEFIINAVNYLTDETGLINLRGREFKMRTLDKMKILEERVKWQIINTILPVIIVLLAGLIFNHFRKRFYI